jgi:hypothetical protein
MKLYNRAANCFCILVLVFSSCKKVDNKAPELIGRWADNNNRVYIVIHDDSHAEYSDCSEVTSGNCKEERNGTARINGDELHLCRHRFSISQWPAYDAEGNYFIRLDDKTFIGCAVPAMLTVDQVTSTSAQLNWFSDPAYEKFTIEYKKSSAPQWSSVDVFTYYYMLSGLSASTSYDWRVKAYCQGNNSMFTAVSTFVTQ